MRQLAHIALGVVLAAATWTLLELIQSWFFQAAQRVDVGVSVPAFALVGGGFLLILAVSWRPIPTLSVATAGIVLLAVVGPLALHWGNWWPDAFPGSVLRLATFTGTWITIGVLLGVAAIKVAPGITREENRGEQVESMPSNHPRR